MRRLVRAGAALLLALSCVVLAGPGAGAHAYLESSNPGDGATLARAPHQLRLGFSEHVVLPATRVTLTDGAGRHYRVTDLRVVSADAADTEAPSEVVGTLPELPRHTYRVAWETLSGDYLHRTAGVLVFGVRTAVAPTPFREPPPAPGETALTALLLVGLALALGSRLAARALARVPAPGGALRLMSRLTVLGAAVALVASLVPHLVQALVGRSDLGQVLGGSYGVRWGVRESGLVLLLVAAVAAHRGRTGTWPGRLLPTGAGLATLGVALLGHAAASHEQSVRVVATTIHVGSALTWSGAVGCLSLALLLARRATPRPAYGAALRWFGRPAAVCAGLVAVTGVYLASESVGSVDAGLLTTYGRALLLKLGLVVVVGGLALANHRRLHGPDHVRMPRRTVAAEAVVATLVVLVTAVLVSGQPATEPQLVDAGPRTTAGPLAGQVGDLQESFDVRPNRPGDASAVVTVFDTRRPSPGPVREVSVRWGAGAPVLASAQGDGTWVARVPDIAAGTTPVRVRVTRDDVGAVDASYRWTVGPAAAPRPALVSRAPVRDLLRWAAGASAAGLVLTAAVAARRSRQQRVGPVPTTTAAGAPPEPAPTGERDLTVV